MGRRLTDGMGQLTMRQRPGKIAAKTAGVTWAFNFNRRKPSIRRKWRAGGTNGIQAAAGGESVAKEDGAAAALQRNDGASAASNSGIKHQAEIWCGRNNVNAQVGIERRYRGSERNGVSEWRIASACMAAGELMRTVCGASQA
jgi:hypothetical protein